MEVECNCICGSHYCPVVGAVRILPPYSLHFIKGDKKRQCEGSGKPSSVFFTMKRQIAEGERRIKSP